MDRHSGDAPILRPDVTGRRVAAAGFGIALSLPLAATAVAMPVCACGGPAAKPKADPPPQPQRSTHDDQAPAAQRGAAAAAPAARRPDPAPAPQLRRIEPTPQPSPTPRPQAAPEPQRQPAPDPKPQPAPPRAQQYGMDSFTYHHLPPDDQAPIRGSYEAKHAPKPQAQPDPKPQAAPDPKPQAQPDPKPQAQPDPTPQAQPDPKPQPAPPRPQQYGMDSFTYHHLPPDDQASIRGSYEAKYAPKPQAQPDPKPPPAALRPQQYGMDSFTYHHLPPDDQASIRDSWNKKHGIEQPQIGFQPQPATRGPSIAEGERPVGLSFPGTLSITCTEDLVMAKGSCRPGPTTEPPAAAPGAEPKSTGSFKVEAGLTETSGRTDPVLSDDGNRRTSLSVSTDLRVTGEGSTETRRGVELGLSAYLGHSQTYQVTVDSGRADDISSGRQPAPNPIDPRSLEPGDGLMLREEDYDGSEGKATYRGLQGALDYTDSRRVSAGVEKVDSDTARVYVGDENVVKNALKLGLGTDDLGIGLSMSNEFGDGKLRSVDLNLGTKAGWDTYQRFVAEGRVPAVDKPNTPGVEDASNGETASWSGGSSLELHAGPIKIERGGTSVEGQVTEARHPDGTVDNNMTGRNGDVTLVEKASTDARGTETGHSYGLLLQNLDKSYVGPLSGIHGGSEDNVDKNQDVKLDFSEGDLETLRHQALERLQYGLKQAGQPMSISEIDHEVRGNPYANVYSGAGPADDSLIRSIASAEYPRDVLTALYTQAHGSSNELVDFLLRHHMSMGMVDHSNPLETQAPGSLTVYGPGS